MDAAGQARAQDRVEHVDAAAPVAAGDDELAVGPAPHQAARTPRSRAARSCAPAAPRRRARTACRCRSARARAPPASVQRPEGGADAVRDGDHLGGVEPVLVAHVGARELRDGDHARRAAHRSAHEAEQRAIAAREQLRRARVGDVVHGHDRRAAQARRDEVVRVGERGALAARERREGERDAAVGARDVEPQPAHRGRHVRRAGRTDRAASTRARARAPRPGSSRSRLTV